ncbi:Putative ribonuclease H protein At1g65750 [Linum perenne]
MAQSVLSAIPAYAMQTAVLPSKTCEEIDKRIRNFVWGTTAEERKICLVAWDKVCSPKENGGLGLRLSRQLNRAFLTKLAFIFMKDKDKLWVKVLQHKYFRQTEEGLARRNLKSSSPLWKGMLNEWQTMVAGAKSAIRDGTETLFWTNNWVDSNLRLIDFANTDEPDFDPECTVAAFVDASGQWDYHKLARLLTPEAVDVVAGMTPPQENRGADDWVWGLEKSGLFSIKSAYNLICQTNSLPISNLWKGVWKWRGPNRIKHFLWLAAKDKLLTNEGRCRRGLSDEETCRWCDTETESILHVLRDCRFAKATWRAVGGFDVDGAEWKLATNEWFLQFLGGEMALRFGIVCWYLWKARNERLFAGSVEGAGVIAVKCIRWEDKVGEALKFEGSVIEAAKSKRQIEVAWQAGQPGWVTVNSDGSVLGTRGHAAAGGLLRDGAGNCIHAFAFNLGVCSITRAEIRGALEGIRRAWAEGFRRVEVQMDSQAAIAILLDKSLTIAHQHALEVLEFRDWMNRDWVLRLKHVYREANRAADFLANLGHSMPRGCHEVPISDCNLAYHVRYDCMGISEPRLVN